MNPLLNPDGLKWDGTPIIEPVFIECPCCAGPMQSDLVVCRICWGLTNRLTPGRHFMLKTIRNITQPEIELWSASRDVRAVTN